ncbi:adenosylmethionine--8-amino-7-oxononanoate transaminase [Fulvivirgaceae bacterium BMA10]|uniref:Adenosylmethionine-8-amino-7-oxononanoate aminotransferase n=1 Tax=Splendidivirga corallicola TaxID=3051826 RepID=A0ABT8KGN2_9BACT|nr:adenosylmethionine--8-amino-7-oxononanoate transaminase [Fulvivirgaceae bacterium BMA10]
MNKTLLARDQEVVWHPFTPLKNAPQPLVVKSGKGIYLTLEDGREIIDAISSWWVNIHGHANEYIAQAIAKQALQLEHVIFGGFTHEPAIKLAENVLSVLPPGQNKVFYSDNGSTAVEVGLKMAMQYWYNRGITKKKVIAIRGAYHGDTFGAMSVGERGGFTAAFSPYLFEVNFIDFPTSANQDEVYQQFEAIVESEEVGAFIFEPLLQGSGGMRVYDHVFLDKLIKKAKEKNVVCIADEVMTGFGRTGKWFASDYLENKPDIFCLSKGLTGGTMALGATSCSSEIVRAFESEDVMKTFFHGHSFTANPIACACANASFELLSKKSCWENIQRIQDSQLRFKEQMTGHPNIRDIRVCGTVCAIELDFKGQTSYFNKSRNHIYNYFLEKNILLRPLGNVIYVMPPYIIEERELEEIHNAIGEFLDTI